MHLHLQSLGQQSNIVVVFAKKPTRSRDLPKVRRAQIPNRLQRQNPTVSRSWPLLRTAVEKLSGLSPKTQTARNRRQPRTQALTNQGSPQITDKTINKKLLVIWLSGRPPSYCKMPAADHRKGDTGTRPPVSGKDFPFDMRARYTLSLQPLSPPSIICFPDHQPARPVPSHFSKDEGGRGSF